MHVCHVVAGVKGGPEIIVRQLVEAQLAQGHTVSLVFSSVRDDPDVVKASFPPSTRLEPWTVAREIAKSDVSAYRELAAILRRLRPDMVHLHSSKAGALGRPACLNLGLPNIYSPHGLSYLRQDVGPGTRALFYAAEWGLALTGDCVAASSQGERDAIRGLIARKRLIPNGLDVPAITAQVEPGVADLQTGPDKPYTIVITGRIEPQKNPQFVAELAAASPSDWRWIWIGEGALRPVLEQSGRIELTGWITRSQALTTVSQGDVYLQASLWEGMSFALLEAMALGRPCVVSDVVGNRDVVEPGISGFVCRKPDEYLAALSRLQTDTTFRKRLGQGAYDAILSTYNVDVILRRWEELYDEVLSLRGRAKADTSR